jgi:phage gpG-like protein
MIQLSFNGSDQRIAVALRAKGPQIIQLLVSKMNALMLQLQAKIVGQKLQGQVLAHRTGKLSGSIRMIPATVDGSLITGAVEGAGGPAFYGRIHEFGGTFPINRKKEISARLDNRPRKGSATFPERSFMRTSLEEMRQEIFTGLTTAMNEELSK